MQAGSVSADCAQRTADGAAIEGYQSMTNLTVEYLEEHGLFDLPMIDACTIMKVGESTLKKACRNIGVNRWPFRKRRSLEVLESLCHLIVEHLRATLAEHGFKEAGTLLADTLAVMDRVKGCWRDKKQLYGEVQLPKNIRQFRQRLFGIRSRLNKRANAAAARGSALSATEQELLRILNTLDGGEEGDEGA